MRAPGEAQGGGRGVSMTDASEQRNAVTPRPRVAFGLLNVLLERLGGLLGTEDEREAIREALGVLDELIKAVNEGDLSAFPSRTAQALANARWAPERWLRPRNESQGTYYSPQMGGILERPVSRRPSLLSRMGGLPFRSCEKRRRRNPY